MKILRTLFLTLFVLFAMIGAIQFGTLVHEYSHYLDYKDVDLTNQEICILELTPSDDFWSTAKSLRGYFAYSYKNNTNNTDISKIIAIRQYTEIKAYSINTIIIFFYIIGLWFLFDLLLEKEVLRYEVRKLQKV